jgi:DNA-binding transcriptional MocR family regulator
MIIEDDPYWYLQFPSAASLEASARGLPPPPAPPVHTFAKSSGFAFLDSLVPSYLNVDTDGRVIRLDTFSKTVAPGCRLGWITAQPAIVERILRITETSTQQPSGFVQAMIAELVMGPQPSATTTNFKSKKGHEQASFTGWKVDGWVRWLEGLRGTYERRMNRMCTHLEEGRFQVKQGTPTKSSDSEWAVISKTKMYSFDWPRGGMFVWVGFHFENHPLFGTVSGPRLANCLWIFFTMKPNLILISPGAVFSPTDEIREAEGWKYFRMCFAAVSEEEVDAASKRFAVAAAKFWLIKDEKDLDAIDETVNSKDMQDGLVDLSLTMAC